MNARKKLNNIYLLAACAIAIAFGALTGSVTVFSVTLALATFGFLHDGSIRPNRKRR